MDLDEQQDAFIKAGRLKLCLEGLYPGRYLLEEILGAGGSGLVVKARDKNIGRVAIKVVVPQDGRPAFLQKERARLEREIATMQRASHTNVVVFHQGFFSQDDSMCVMTLEFLNGEVRFS
jgi:serine/threonine protein kinase